MTSPRGALVKPLPSQALVFKCRTWSVYRPGTVVQMVGIGRAQRADRDPDDDSVYIRAQCVHLKDCETFVHDWHREWWYFRAADLRPLTPAAARALDTLRAMERGQ